MLPCSRAPGRRSRPFATAAALLVYAASTGAAGSPPAVPGGPASGGPVGTFQIVGDSMVSAQQLFVGTADKVYIVDKTENNPTQIQGHPAWAAEYALGSNSARAMDVVTNSFCAGGNVLGNGTWVNIGGNQAVTTGGVTAASQTGSPPYNDPDGGKSLLDPCDDGNCDWSLTGDLATRRWYPSVEALDDGSLLIIGGCEWGGFVNDAAQTNPTYEFFPPRGNPVTSPILTQTLPANLYPLTFLLPSARVLVQTNWQTAILDYKKGTEYRIDDVPDAVRTYPASAGVVMMPLTPKNNWTATVMFCGGQNIASNRWVTNWNIAQHPASQSCVQLTPDLSGAYTHVDPLPEGRTMGNLILLPTGQVVCLNGAGTGVAGYGNDSWAVGWSYADHPLLFPVMFNGSAPPGSQWSREGFTPSTVERMYHSTATLLPDGSILVTGSNPNPDYNVNVPYVTEYRVEKFYPPYFSSRRPQPAGLPLQVGYGGDGFDVTLSKDDLFGDIKHIEHAKVVVMRMGFSTHTMNMGQRMVELESSYTVNSDGSAILHCSSLPPNPAIFQPGPAFIYVVVNHVPSVGIQIMVGSGQIGQQPVKPPAPLPTSVIAKNLVGSEKGNASVSGAWQANPRVRGWTGLVAGVVSAMMALV
ncbi:copper radical oxidase [Auriscalpium vulgare]|uniref:Copper radical oxidase n=1 Tax=Auriscalpium vulgare TaxID=40419 RepID=A0ACB8RP77_9AGAM|nr:copper radical oxidase [Auriscalpium vulgare]